MKAYKVELLIIDHDKCGADGIKNVLESAGYPNRCIYPRVQSVEERDIGEWTDEHPLNHSDKVKAEYARLFATSAAPLAWIYEDTLPEGYPYDAMFPYSKVDVVRMFPVFAPASAAPQGEAAKLMQEIAKVLRWCPVSAATKEPAYAALERLTTLTTLATSAAATQEVDAVGPQALIQRLESLRAWITGLKGEAPAVRNEAAKLINDAIEALLNAEPKAPDAEPDFFVEIVIDKDHGGAKLQYALPGFGGKREPGKYVCYRIAPPPTQEPT